MGDGEDPGPNAIITPEKAVLGAVAGFERYGLLADPDWKPLLVPFLDRQPIRPLLVRRLDAKDPTRRYYYLVAFGASASTIGAAARVHAISGEYQEATAIPQIERRPWGGVAAEWSIDTSKAASGTVDVSQALVWKPCEESGSPFYPFRVVTVGGQRRYVRIDGEAFDELTDLPPYPG
jgi:hypothetical protein